MDVKSTFDFRCLYNKKALLVFSLIIVLLFSSLFIYVRVVGVGDESELKRAINYAPPWVPVTITLNRDITLTESLVIPTNRAITLRSNNNEYFRLNGADKCYTLVVDAGGTLKLYDLIIAHKSGAYGSGVRVYPGGTLILYSGKIFSNTACRIGGAQDDGGGVYNEGTFKMLGGEISFNKATLYGGGVYNRGTFEMSGGKISNNRAGPHAVRYSGSGGGISGSGGGVDNCGVFSMSGGEISNNISASGGGVANWGTFEFSDGRISSNRAVSGNIFYNSDSRGSVSAGGGVCNWGIFKMSGGEITKNRVDSRIAESGYGGGVYTSLSTTFEMSGGGISGNIASSKGNDIYNYGE